MDPEEKSGVAYKAQGFLGPVLRILRYGYKREESSLPFTSGEYIYKGTAWNRFAEETQLQPGINRLSRLMAVTDLATFDGSESKSCTEPCVKLYERCRAAGFCASVQID